MSADISKLREIVGNHLASWRGTTPLEDFANVDDVYRTLMPELEEFFAAHTKQAQLDLLGELEKEHIWIPCLDTTENHDVIPLTALQAKRKELEI